MTDRVTIGIKTFLTPILLSILGALFWIGIDAFKEMGSTLIGMDKSMAIVSSKVSILTEESQRVIKKAETTAYELQKVAYKQATLKARVEELSASFKEMQKVCETHRYKN